MEMPQDLVTAAFGGHGKEAASAAVPSCKVELTELSQQVTNFEADANGDYEVGRSTVTSNEFRVYGSGGARSRRGRAHC